MDTGIHLCNQHGTIFDSMIHVMKAQDYFQALFFKSFRKSDSTNASSNSWRCVCQTFLSKGTDSSYGMTQFSKEDVKAH